MQTPEISALLQQPAAAAETPQTQPHADSQAFKEALTKAEMAAAPPGSAPADAVTPAMKTAFSSLQRLDHEASTMVESAQEAAAKGKDLTPGEMTMLTLRAHEFMFHAQITSNVANRTSDGLQQLFRQQN